MSKNARFVIKLPSKMQDIENNEQKNIIQITYHLKDERLIFQVVYFSSSLLQEKMVKTTTEKDEFSIFFLKGNIFHHSDWAVWSTYFYL